MVKRRSSRKKQTFGGFFSVVLMLVGAAGFGYWWTTNRWAPIETQAEKPTAPVSSQNRVAIHGRKDFKIYVLNVKNDEPRLVAETHRVPQGDDPKTGALETLIATNRESGDRHYLIPAGTKLVGLHVKDGVAYVDFSREIRDNFLGGSTNEALLVNSIVHTMTQFKDVDKVQILVEGKRIESLGGHLDISQPISGDATMLGEGDSE